MRNLLSRPLYIQTLCHLFYILLSFKIHSQERPLYLIFSLWAFIFLVDFIFTKIQHIDKYVFPIGSIAIGNSIYLNMEAYGSYYWPFFLAIILSIAAKYYLRVQGKPILNPSLVGVLFISTILPQFGAAAMYEWNTSWIYVLMVFSLGTFISILVNTYTLSFSYIISFMIFSFLASYISHQFPDSIFSIVPKEAPIMLYSLSIFAFGNILFAFHGIGDPSTSPETHKGKIIFGIFMGFLDLLLRAFVVLVAPFLAYTVALLILSGYRLYNQKKQENLELAEALPSS